MLYPLWPLIYKCAVFFSNWVFLLQSQVVYTEVPTGCPNLRQIIITHIRSAVSLHTWTGGRSGTIIRTSGGEQSGPSGVPELLSQNPVHVCKVIDAVILKTL